MKRALLQTAAGCCALLLLLAAGWFLLNRRDTQQRAERMAEIEASLARDKANDRLRQEAARQEAKEEEEQRKVARSYADSLKDIWQRYDQEPKTRQTKARLGEAADEVAMLVETAPQYLKQQVANAGLSEVRKRTAPLIRPESYAEGAGYRTLVPSKDEAKCLLWGSMWANNNAEDMKKMGFQRIACPDHGKAWEL